MMGFLCDDYQLRCLCSHPMGLLLQHKLVELATHYLPENVMSVRSGGPGRRTGWGVCSCAVV